MQNQKLQDLNYEYTSKINNIIEINLLIKYDGVTDKEKILKTLSSLLETGILTVNDVKKEFITNFKFKKENLVNQLDLVSREEFEVLKRLVDKQDLELKKLKKTKKVK